MYNRCLIALILAGAVLAGPCWAIRYEVVPDEGTIIWDDSRAIVMGEYAKRARESMAAKKPLTAAAQLRRVADLARSAADSASGQARRSLLGVWKQALRLAYAAETRSDSALRRIREFASRLDNFIGGEWALLEAKHAVRRGDRNTAAVFLKMAAQQLERRAGRLGKVRGVPFELAAGEVRDLLSELDQTNSAVAESKLAELIKTARDLEPAKPTVAVATTISPQFTYPENEQYIQYQPSDSGTTGTDRTTTYPYSSERYTTGTWQ